MVWVVKAQGEREEFDAAKVLRTCLRAGADKAVAERVARDVAARVKDGWRTRDILRLTLSLLDKAGEEKAAARYDLKGAIMRLGPAGFAFETFFAELLREYGFGVKTRQIIQGECISHEVDVVAVSPEGKRFMVECKYKNYSGEYIKVKDALYTYARYLDACGGGKTGSCERFDGVWLATNTKFSSDVEKYAACKGMRLTSWSLPEGESLSELIEKKSLYPITMLRAIDSFSQKKLASASLMLCRDLCRMDEGGLRDSAGIPKKKGTLLLEEARRVCNSC